MTRLISSLAAVLLSTAPALADRVSVLVFDASGSMWNRVEGDLTRIEVARDVMGDYFASRDGAVPLSVIAYGHNRRGDCGDIEVIAPMGQTAPGTLETRLRALMPRGMTPLTDSLALARDQIPPTAEGADIILVTDGLETCAGDPCALAASLAAEGIDIRAHVVGFGLTAAEVAALSCITDQTGGMLFQANSGAELAEALQQVSAAPPPPPPPVAEPGTPALFAQNFVFRDIGTGTPRGLMDWRAEAPDGTVIDLGTTDGIQQSLLGVSVEMPLGDWLIVAEGAEGRAERQMTLTQCCGRHGIPFTGNEMAAVIPPLGQVQAGMGARIPYEITHPGVGNLGGTPHHIIATGPEGALTPDQILRDDYITNRRPGLRGGATGELAPGTYRSVIAIRRNQQQYDILAERTFEAVANPVVQIMAPDLAMPGERIAVGFEGGYATRYEVELVDATGGRIGQWNALYRGPGGSLTMDLGMPNREGVFDLVVRRTGHPNDRETVLARRRITISATPAPAQGQGQDMLPAVTATFRQPPGLPFDMSHWRAEPLDPDLPPEGLRIDGSGPVVTASLQPGRWRIIAEGMADTILYTEVDIFPGQPNDFTLDMDAMQVDGALTGDWTLWALPPQGIADPPMNFARISLRPTAEGMDYIGSFTTTAAMGGVQSGDLQQVTIDGDGLFEILFVLPAAGPEPLRLALMQPLGGAGFEGQLIARTGVFPIALLPEGTPPPERQGSVAPQGNIPNDAEIAARCDTPGGCVITIGTVSLILPEGWAMTEPLFFRAVGHEIPSDWPMATFYGPAMGEVLQLNPHQWLISNGPCQDTRAGPLCWFSDAPTSLVAAAAVIASNLTMTAPKAVEGSVTVGLFDPDIIAGSGGFFPIDFAAPQGFQGAISLHDGTGTVIFSADAAFMLGAQDQVLPVPDAPGPHEIRVTDNTGALRATTGFFAAPASVPVTADATGIRVTLTATTQFGAACTIGSSLTLPDGPVFTFAATVRGEDNSGQAIDPLMRTEGDQRIDITGFGGAGAARFEIGYRAPCEDVILRINEAQCSIGDGAPPGACPYPVTYVIPSNLLGVFLSGSDRIEQASLATPAPDQRSIAAAPAVSEPRFIPIALGDRDADEIIDLLFPPN